jgi:CheY-like chemotaxis protein
VALARSATAEAPDEDETDKFAPTTMMAQLAEEEFLREQQEQAARVAAEQAEREAEREATLRATLQAEAQAQAQRAAAREAAEALARQRAAEDHARREFQLRQQEEEQRRLAAAAAQAEATRLAAAPPAHEPEPDRVPEQTLVMVVDDSKVVRVKTSRLLAKHHYQVVLAEDGEQALQLIAREMPQVLITDVEMPGIDGVELTRRLRAKAGTARLPIIMITSADDRLRGVAKEVGVSVLLGKPYADDALIDSIEKLAGIAPGARLSTA